MPDFDSTSPFMVPFVSASVEASWKDLYDITTCVGDSFFCGCCGGAYSV